MSNESVATWRIHADDYELEGVLSLEDLTSLDEYLLVDAQDSVVEQ